MGILNKTENLVSIVFASIVLVFSISMTESIYAQNPPPGTNLPYIPYLPLVATSIAITASIALYYYQEKRSKRLTAARARTALLKEVDQNKIALTGGDHERIQYQIPKGNEQKLVKYTNAYLEADSYNSVLYSGLLTYFSIRTLHTLTMLYSRMKSRNELLTYMDQLEDMFFLRDETQDHVQIWQKKIEKYDLLITAWEKEIIELMDEAKMLLENEKTKQRRFP